MVSTVVEQDAVERISTVRLRHGDDPFVTDLLFASCGIEAEIVEAAEVLPITDQLRLPVASVGHLIAMKLLARDDRNRPTDADDLRGLALIAQPEDWQLSHEAVELITQRGFNRGRDLVTALAHLRQQGAY